MMAEDKKLAEELVIDDLANRTAPAATAERDRLRLSDM
jgi:hypothetical protein